MHQSIIHVYRLAATIAPLYGVDVSRVVAPISEVALAEVAPLAEVALVAEVAEEQLWADWVERSDEVGNQ